MAAKYVEGSSGYIYLLFDDNAEGELHLVALCNADQSAKAVALLNRARHFNDVKRKYTKAANLIAQAVALPGFKWTDERFNEPKQLEL